MTGHKGSRRRSYSRRRHAVTGRPVTSQLRALGAVTGRPVTAWLRAAGYVIVPDPAGFLRIRRRRSAHL